MSKVTVHPYPYAKGALTSTCTGMTAGVVKEGPGAFSCEDVGDADSLKLTFSVAVTDGVFDLVLPAEEREEPPVSVLIALQGLGTRYRSGAPLTFDGTSWVGSVVLDKSTLYGDVQMTPIMVRTSAGSSDEYARAYGQVLADGDPAKLVADELPTRAGGTLEFRFESFASPGAPAFCRLNDRQLFALEIDSDSEAPVVWFNSDVPNLEGTVKSKAKTGVPRIITDSVMASVVSEVWTALCLVTIMSLSSAIADQLDDAEALESLDGWQKSVAMDWGAKLFRANTRQDGYEALCKAIRAGALADVIGRLGLAVQEQASMDETYKRMQDLRFIGQSDD